MQAHRGAGRHLLTRRRLVVFGVCLVLGYGFFIQTKDFPSAGEGFHWHRKDLMDEKHTLLEVSGAIQKEAETLQLEGRKNFKAMANLPPQSGEQLPNNLPLERVNEEKAAAWDRHGGTDTQLAEGQKGSAGHSAAAEDKEPLLQSLVQQQELRISQNTSSSGFQPLPPMRKAEPQAALVHQEAGKKFGGVAFGDSVSEGEWRARQNAVKVAAKESWAAYENYAMGYDELRPLSLEGKTCFGDMAATLVDSLDTLWMLGLQDEFSRAKAWLMENLNFDKAAKLSLFETVIRIVGGLLSAYDLSEDSAFLRKAQRLVDMLLPVFDTSPKGIPNNVVYINQGAEKKARNSQLGRAAIAEFGSLQVEFVALSHRTANASYGEKAERIIKHLHDTYPDQGLLPVWFNRRVGKFSGSKLYTVGAMGDSYFEYLLKLWLLHQKQEDMYRSMWEQATDETLAKLVAITPEGLTFVGQKKNTGKLYNRMEHLACYFPGNMALGVAQGAVSGDKARHYLDVAANLTYTCWQMYERTATGLGMEAAKFDDKGVMFADAPGNQLRPEAIESLFYLWRITGEPKYRDWGWQMFQAFQKHSRTPEGAYASVKDVNQVPVNQTDSMESFWLAETLKYLWLLFGPDELLSLEDWVLNTEAHPLRIALPST